MNKQLEMQCVVKSLDGLGEGCLWDAEEQVLWWLDIARPGRLHRFNPATSQHDVLPLPRLVASLAKRKQGGFILGAEDGVYFFNPLNLETTLLCKPEAGNATNRLNDGTCDPQGRFWVGSMMQNIGPQGQDLPITADTGSLYSLTNAHDMRKWATSIGVSNGPCWSPDGRIFYFSDSRNQIIYAYDFDASTGAISNRRILNSTKDYGYPDGATVDAEGFIWSARWEGSCLLRIAPTGEIVTVLPVPATRVTCPVFGGPDLKTLYVTTSRDHVSAEVLAKYPDQGGVFACQPGPKGLLKNQFAF